MPSCFRTKTTIRRSLAFPCIDFPLSLQIPPFHQPIFPSSSAWWKIQISLLQLQSFGCCVRGCREGKPVVAEKIISILNQDGDLQLLLFAVFSMVQGYRRWEWISDMYDYVLLESRSQLLTWRKTSSDTFSDGRLPDPISAELPHDSA
jgi:hypothetical protein